VEQVTVHSKCSKHPPPESVHEVPLTFTAVVIFLRSRGGCELFDTCDKTGNVLMTVRRICVTIFAMEKQEVSHILCVTCSIVGRVALSL